MTTRPFCTSIASYTIPNCRVSDDHWPNTIARFDWSDVDAMEQMLASTIQNLKSQHKKLEDDSVVAQTLDYEVTLGTGSSTLEAMA
jgi:hypothetical protein